MLRYLILTFAALPAFAQENPAPFASFDLASEQILADPHDLAIGPDGRLYVADKFGARIAVMGRPTAYLKDGGSDLHRAAAILEEQGIGSLCIDDISHAAASMLKRTYQDHPAFARFLSACGQASGKLKQTLLACLAPPTVQPWPACII